MSILDANRTCDGKQFDCNTALNGTVREPKCIKTAKVCDGKYDCINMHDEKDCGMYFNRYAARLEPYILYFLGIFAYFILINI
jgi:hypothetical protein